MDISKFSAIKAEAELVLCCATALATTIHRIVVVVGGSSSGRSNVANGRGMPESLGYAI